MRVDGTAAEVLQIPAVSVWKNTRVVAGAFQVSSSGLPTPNRDSAETAGEVSAAAPGTRTGAVQVRWVQIVAWWSAVVL